MRVRPPPIPVTPTKITLLNEMCAVSFQEKCSRVLVLDTGHINEPGLSCAVGGASGSLHYGFHIIISIQASDALIMKTRTGGRAVDRSIETNNLYAPTPNGQCPSALLNKRTPSSPVRSKCIISSY